MLVTERSAGRRLPSEADVSGRTLKHRFVDCMAACELSDVTGLQNFGEFLVVST